MRKETLLKPCPFCGSRNVDFYWEEDQDYIEDSTYVVECQECLARGTPFSTIKSKAAAKEGAGKAWNKRACEE